MSTQYETLITEVGTADYPYLFKPDTKFNANGEYHVKLTLPEDISKKMIDQYNSVLVNFQKEVGKDKRSPHDQFSKVEKGYQWKFKSKAKVKGKNGSDYEIRPKIYDASNNLITEEIPCYSGSEMKIAYQMRPYHTPTLGVGVKLVLVSVQITKLVSDSGTSKSSSPLFKKTKGFNVSESPVNLNAEKASEREVSPETNEEDF